MKWGFNEKTMKKQNPTEPQPSGFIYSYRTFYSKEQLVFLFLNICLLVVLHHNRRSDHVIRMKQDISSIVVLLACANYNYKLPYANTVVNSIFEKVSKN